jgi:uncharacterized protein (TIGR04255 family)
MQYKNPPVVEVGIFFNFYPSSETPEWNEESVTLFFQHEEIKKQFCNPEKIYQHLFHVKSDIQTKTASTTTALRLNEMLAKDEKSLKILSIGENQLAYRMGRKDNEFPHYEAVAQSIFGILSIYKKFWKPERIKNVSLSYVDVVKIPELQIELGDYFSLCISFPSDLGAASFMEGRIVIPDEKGYKDVLFRQVSAKDKSKKEIIFQFFWTSQRLLDINTQNECDVKDVMDELHKDLRGCFELSFTDKCKNLFNPF